MRWLVLFVVACSSQKPSPPSPPPSNTATAPTTQTRCLAVVAKECHCVYDCGKGESTDGTHWKVTHDFWKGTKLDAVIEPWCVEGKCTDVFAAQIVCDGICSPKPARSDCRC